MEEQNKVRARAQIVADSLIRIGRTYLSCVTAPNRNENKAQEANFADALADFVVIVMESDV